MRSPRFILLLDPRYAEEREVSEMIKSAPEGEGASFTRALLLLGFNEIKQNKLRSQIFDGAPTPGQTDETRTP